MFKARTRPWSAILFVTILAAFALRVFRIQSQSLWYDEAFSVYLARMDLGAILTRTAADIQPPLYYFLLHFWMSLAGDPEFAVRSLSLFFGVLTVPLFYVTARRLFNPAAGLAAALIALISPLYLWYSQEARMYTLITFLGLLSSYALLRALATNRRGWWFVFALANIAALYTHYFALVLIAFQFVYWLWDLVAHRAWRVRAPLVAFAAILLSFLPWIPLMLNRLGEDASYWRGPLKIDEAIRHIFINFTMGESVLENDARLLAAGWLAFLLIGLGGWILVTRREGRHSEKAPRAVREQSFPAAEPSGLAFAILYLVIPLALLLLLFYRNPKFNPRYLMIASPGLVLLLSTGLAALFSLARSSRPAGRVLSGALLVASVALLGGTALFADNNAYFDPAFTKADFRGVAQYISTHASADEAIILTSGHMFPAFDYYYSAPALPELRLPDDPTLNTEHVLGFSAADDLNRGVAGKTGVWLVAWQDDVVDPNGIVPLLLSTRGQEQKVESSFWQVKLRHWALRPDAHFSAQPEPTVNSNANFKNRVRLLGLAQTDPPSPADEGATFNLYWQTLDTMTEDYQVSLRVVDAQGNLWGKLDRRPAGYNYPTTRWRKGESLFGSYKVPLLPGTPAGEYLITATLFTAAEQTGLDVLDPKGAPVGKTVKLGPVVVGPASKPPPLLDLKIQHTLMQRAGPLTLLGYNLPRDQASSGETIPLTVYWRADEPPGADYSFQIQFGDKASAALPLANSVYPSSSWRAGEIVRGQYLIQVPPDAASGTANLQVRLLGPDGQTVDLVQPFAILKTDRVFVQPTSPFKQEAIFANTIALVGYGVSAPQVRAGDTVTVTLIWKALGKMDKPYTIFVHLLDKNSQVAGQKDAQPANGNRPTPTWVEGEYIEDSFPIQVKPEAASGDDRVEVGWYDAGDPAYARLPVVDATGAGAGDNVILNQTIQVIVRP